MKKKILFVIPSLVGGGAEKVLITVLRYLNRNLYEPVIVVFNDKNAYTGEIPSDLLIISLDKKGKFDNFRLIKSLGQVIKDQSPSLICCFLYYTNFLTALALILFRLKTPLIFTEHNNVSWSIKNANFPLLKKILVRALYFKADHIICVSNGVKKDLVENFAVTENICSTVYNPIEIDKIQSASQETPDHQWFQEDIPMVIMCGRLTHQKNQRLALEAVALILKNRINVRVAIIGEGELKGELVALANKIGISEKVIFLGFQENPFKYITRAHMLILSSLWEGFGNVIVEAMACGTPVISTRCQNGPEEIISNGIDGFLVPIGDKQAMADAMQRVLQDESTRKKLSEAGRKRALDFKADRIVDQYAQIFDKYSK